MIGALAAGAGLVMSCAITARIPDLVHAPRLFLTLVIVAFACYAAGIWRLATLHGPRPMFVIIAVAVAARLMLVAASPTLSTDVYRYVWDARVAHAGISPYLYPPWAQELEPLRDIGLAAVFGLLRASGRPVSQLVIYAWNPLVLFEVWGMGHLDALIIPAVAGAAWAALRARYVTAGVLLGLGTLVKLYPAALLPLLPIAGWPAACSVFLVVAVSGYVPALIAGTPVVGSLPRYVSEEYFNPGLLRSVLDVPALTLAVAGIWIVFVSVTRRDATLSARAVLLIGGLTLLSPNIFPWYAVWLVPFLAVAPSAPWLAFTGSVMFAYAFFLQQPWGVPPWARIVEFAPLAVGALCWLIRRYPALRWERRAA